MDVAELVHRRQVVVKTSPGRYSLVPVHVGVRPRRESRTCRGGIRVTAVSYSCSGSDSRIVELTYIDSRIAARGTEEVRANMIYTVPPLIPAVGGVDELSFYASLLSVRSVALIRAEATSASESCVRLRWGGRP